MIICPDDYYKMKEEIIRLNNIIKELEKFLIEEIEDYDKNINSRFITDIALLQYEGEKVCFEDMLGKLQELKGKKKIGEVVSIEELESYLPQNDYEVMEQDLLFKD